jgi:TPR repeat protein
MNKDILTLKSEAERGNADKQFELSQYYFEKEENIEECIHWLKAASSQKHPFAMTNLAICLYFGDGVEKSYKTSFPMFEEASELGDINAKYYLGLSYLNGHGTEKDIVKGFPILLECAKEGMSLAQLAVADCYKDGVGTTVDLFEAVGWYYASAEQGIEEAGIKFNEIYYFTSFHDENGEQRFLWFEEEHLRKTSKSQ